VIEGASEYGYKAIGVPGSVAGMVYAEQKYGKLTLQQVMAPAIRLARRGFALSWAEGARFRRDKYLAKFAESRRIFQPIADLLSARADIFRQPDLARTLERIAAKPETFITGTLGARTGRCHAEGGGLIDRGRPGTL